MGDTMRFSFLLFFIGVSLAGLHPSHAQEVAKDLETAYRWYTESLSEGDNDSALRHSQTELLPGNRTLT